MVSPQPSRVRLLLLLYDPVVHEAQQGPRPFAWVPCLGEALRDRSAEALGKAATERLWEELRAGESVGKYWAVGREWEIQFVAGGFAGLGV